MGNRERIDEADGTFREYTYDDLYRLTGDKVSDTTGLVYEKVFDYDPVGNRDVQTTTGLAAGGVNYTYDDRDRLLTENDTVYGHDDNGNLTSKSAEAIYFWDFENRLVRVEKTDGTVVTHAYDADGNRVRTEITPSTGPPTVTNFLVDPSGFLSHVVAKTDDTGTLVAYYVRGLDDLLAVIRPTETRYYHADGLGSIRFLTDETGNITDSYEYTAFGELLGHVGSDPQPYQFAGEPFEPNIGFYYNRARWLDVSVGRFASADRFRGVVGLSASLHRYLYASQNPVNLADPTGLFFTTADVSAALGGLTIIAAQALPRLQAVQGFVYRNYFTIQSTAERILVGLDIISTGLEAADQSLLILERMASRLENTAFNYSSNAQTRGFEVGDVSGQNLGPSFPRIDHREGRALISIKSTTQIDTPDELLRLAQENADEMQKLGNPPVLPGRDARGNRVRIIPSDHPSRGVLIVIPDEPYFWNPGPVFRRIREISRRTRVAIRVVSVKGLRGR